MSGYARLDYRVTEDGRAYLLEANPNPQIARDEDFAQSARHVGITYEELLQRVLQFGLAYAPSRKLVCKGRAASSCKFTAEQAEPQMELCQLPHVLPAKAMS